MWALGISAIEMAEVTPPRWAVHPMRVIFMISREPPPQLADKQRWSPAFQDFVSAMLRKVLALCSYWFFASRSCPYFLQCSMCGSHARLSYAPVLRNAVMQTCKFGMT